MKALPKPKKGFKFIKLDLSANGKYIGQFWYETPTFIKPAWTHILKAMREHFPTIGNQHIIFENVNEYSPTPIELVRICRS